MENVTEEKFATIDLTALKKKENQQRYHMIYKKVNSSVLCDDECQISIFSALSIKIGVSRWSIIPN
jgi:hypothetical protein